MSKVKLFGYDPLRYRYNADRTDPEEFNNRMNNYYACLTKYVFQHPETHMLEQELKRMDLNKYCLKELNEFRHFVKKTDLKYENVYAPVDGYLENLVRFNNPVYKSQE